MVVEQLVKPERMKLANKGDSSAQGYARLWWQFGRKGLDLYAAIERLNRVLVIPETTKYCAFSTSCTGVVFSHMTKVVALDDGASAAILTSSIHEAWVRNYSSTLETRLKYVPTDCFENYP